MPRFTQDDAECRVFTFKEGLLSAMAHDLEIEVARFSVEVDEGRTRVEGTWDPASLRVLHACKDGAPSPGSLSDRDKKKIESNIASDVLEVSRWREIRFTSSAVEASGEALVVRGALELHGRRCEIEARVAREGDRWVTEVTLHQPDFGITPYSAMMGTLRIKPEVRVRIAVPA
ncbi:MAG: YceI family protein [Myxococcota bacterium]|nr:YceI family protein [Myxococcota bacterium]